MLRLAKSITRINNSTVTATKNLRRVKSTATYEFSLDKTSLHQAYLEGKQTVTSVVSHLLNKAKAKGKDPAWIMRCPEGHVYGEAERLDKLFKKDPQGTLNKYPLFGLPYGVKDNIDVAGFATTAGCPAFSYTAWETNPAVDRINEAGGIMLGKNNMDQFAAGLVGVRSPYGVPENPFNPDYCPGGSTSGGGVVVSGGQVSFALSTDTAGSGRVPAGFNNIVGLKPTKGLISTRGVFPACRSLDCVGILALTCDDAWDILQITQGYDFEDEYSRHKQDTTPFNIEDTFRIGIPKQLNFWGLDIDAARKLYLEALDTIQKNLNIKAELVEIDFQPFTETARMLYDGPWVAERLSALRTFYETQSQSFFPTTRAIFERAGKFSAVDTFVAMRTMEKHRKEVERIWVNAKLSALALPTASVTPTISGVNEYPYMYNTLLGYYTNYVNLLDLCGMAVPNGFLPSGVPAGITFIAPAWADNLAYFLGRRFQAVRNLPMGHTNYKLPQRSTDMSYNLMSTEQQYIHVAVAGAHMSGFALNHQLLSLDGKFSGEHKTTPHYRIYDITRPGDKVARPGIVRVAEGGVPVEVEVWRMGVANFGKFMQNLKAPLAIGMVDLDDGTKAHGFVCEGHGINGARDISEYGGWRKYMAASSKKKEKKDS